MLVGMFILGDMQEKKIREKDIVDFFSVLKSPLGYRVVNDEDDDDDFDEWDPQQIQTSISKQEIARKIMLMDLPVDAEGFIPYGVVIHVAARNDYGMKAMEDIDKEAYKIVRTAELNC